MYSDSPRFRLALLHPKYWLIWFFVAIAYLISWLPYSALRLLGAALGKLLKVAAKKRLRIAKRNLELSFPDMSPEQQATLLNDNCFNAGMALVETMMGWWWPDWRLRRISKIEGLEHVEAILRKKKGVLALATHNMSLEVGCRVLGLNKPAVAFYRPHNNPVMDYVQHRGRARSNRYMIHKRDIKALFRSLDDGEVCLYLPDQDYGRKATIFAPLFAVPEVSTTVGPIILANRANCETLFIVSLRTDDGYLVRFTPGIQNFPSGDDTADMTRINRRVEELIMEAPEQYLWMHKRYKTRPDENAPSLYEGM